MSWSISKDAFLESVRQQQDSANGGSSQNRPTPRHAHGEMLSNTSDGRHYVLSAHADEVIKTPHANKEKGVASDEEVLRISSDWSAYLATNAVPEEGILRTARMAFRVCLWGSCVPMSTEEVHIHESVARAMKVDPRDYLTATRPTVNIGIWSLSKSVTYSVTMLAPCVSSASYQLGDEEMDMFNALRSSVIVELPSSMSRDGVSVHGRNSGARSIVGRRSGSVLALIEDRLEESGLKCTARAIFCVLASSKVVFKACVNGRISKCYFGPASLSYLFSRVRCVRGVTLNTSGLIICPAYVDAHASPVSLGTEFVSRLSNSRLTLTHDGNVRFNGSPRDVESSFSVLNKILADTCSDPQTFLPLVKTLRVERLW
jgi:hypothetical protein